MLVASHLKGTERGDMPNKYTVITTEGKRKSFPTLNKARAYRHSIKDFDRGTALVDATDWMNQPVKVRKVRKSKKA